MKLGVFTPPFSSWSHEETYKYLSEKGVQSLEIGCGGYPGNAHLNAKELLSDDKKCEEYLALMKKYNLEISALSCHGNPVHPNKEIAAKFHNEMIDCFKVAQKLGVETVVGFSGCPGDSDTSQFPNWVTCPWPDDFSQILEYQWNEVLIPYWKEMAEIAKEYGIKKIALEMHPGFCVYNPPTLLRLREAVGDIIGANFDPSHLIWQGCNPADSIIALKGAIYHFHAKDTKVYKSNCNVKGVLDTSHYGSALARSWEFRTVGYGTNQETWKEMMIALSAIGYDGAISIEHEDGMMSIKEGLEKAITFLKDVIIFDEPNGMWWA